jgi:hypothetical protein
MNYAKSTVMTLELHIRKGFEPQTAYVTTKNNLDTEHTPVLDPHEVMGSARINADVLIHEI